MKTPASQSDDAFERFLGTVAQRRRGQGQIRTIDDAPSSGHELALYFLSLPVERLASCWVACIVDLVNQGQLAAGEISRPLLVVAERLHGVTLVNVTLEVPENLSESVAKVALPPAELRKAKVKYRPKPLEPGDPRHGTYSGYTNHACRCDACRAANRERYRAMRNASI